MIDRIKCNTVQFAPPGIQDPKEVSTTVRYATVAKGYVIEWDVDRGVVYVGSKTPTGAEKWRSAPYSTVTSMDSGAPPGYPAEPAKPSGAKPEKQVHVANIGGVPTVLEGPAQVHDVPAETAAGHSSRKPDVDEMIRAAAKKAQPTV